MASFLDKPSWDKPKKRGKKNSFPVLFLHDSGRSIPKKIKKIKKCHYGFIEYQTRLGQAKKEIKKKIVLGTFFTTQATFPKK